MKTLIVYFSLEGNTEYAAEKIAAVTGADLLRLIPKKAYKDKGFAKFFWGGKSAVMAEKPKLEPYDADVDSYDRIVFGFPVWASNFTPPIRTFILENAAALKKKRLAAFACQSGSGAQKAFEKLAKYLGVSSFENTAVFIDPRTRQKDSTDKDIEEFARVLKEEGAALS